MSAVCGPEPEHAARTNGRTTRQAVKRRPLRVAAVLVVLEWCCHCQQRLPRLESSRNGVRKGSCQAGRLGELPVPLLAGELTKVYGSTAVGALPRFSAKVEDIVAAVRVV